MANDGMYFKYGNYKHAGAECWFQEERETVFSVEKRPMHVAVRWHIHGFLQADATATNGPANLKSKMQAMADAYANNNQDAGFYLTDGTPTMHHVVSKNTVYGVRVERPPFYPESRGAEGVRWRNYGIVLAWEEPPANDSVLEAESTIEWSGNGGPDWDLIAPVVGPPQFMPKTQGSVLRIIQSGRIIARGFYANVAIPIWPTQPPLHGPSIRTGFHKIPGPEMRRESTWSYTFMFASDPTAIRLPEGKLPAFRLPLP